MNAYLLAGDPAWISESIASYYSIVDRIVVSYDRSSRSWSGHPMSVEAALHRVRAVDEAGKVTLLPGDHVRPDVPAMRAETAQRQTALDAASDGADWVLQLDADEIVTSPPSLRRHLNVADARGATAMEYPLRDIYARVDERRFLEHCGRFWTVQAAYPGPVAVRAGSLLDVARQDRDASRYRVDMAARNTDPAHPFDAPVHAVVDRDEAILHMSWVRSEAQMAEKRIVSGYASNRDWERDLRMWRWRMRHPRLTTLAAPFKRDAFDRFRVIGLPQFEGIDP